MTAHPHSTALSRRERAIARARSAERALAAGPYTGRASFRLAVVAGIVLSLAAGCAVLLILFYLVTAR